jgi:uncharacterized protein HemX
MRESRGLETLEPSTYDALQNKGVLTPEAAAMPDPPEQLSALARKKTLLRSIVLAALGLTVVALSVALITQISTANRLTTAKHTLASKLTDTQAKLSSARESLATANSDLTTARSDLASETAALDDMQIRCADVPEDVATYAADYAAEVEALLDPSVSAGAFGPYVDARDASLDRLTQDADSCVGTAD